MDKNVKKKTVFLKPLDIRDERTPSRCQSVARISKAAGKSGSRTNNNKHAKPKLEIQEYRKLCRRQQLPPLPSRTYIIDDGFELQIIRAPATRHRGPTNSSSESQVDQPVTKVRQKHVVFEIANDERCQSEMQHSDNSDRPTSSCAGEKYESAEEENKFLRVAKFMTQEERRDLWPDRGKTSNDVRQECTNAGIQLIPRNWRETQSSISFDLTFGPPKFMLPRQLPRIRSTSVLEENWQKKEIQKQQRDDEEVQEASKKRKKVNDVRNKRAQYEIRRKHGEAIRRKRERRKVLEKQEAEERARAAFEREKQSRQNKRRELERKIIEEQIRERMK